MYVVVIGVVGGRERVNNIGVVKYYSTAKQIFTIIIKRHGVIRYSLGK